MEYDPYKVLAGLGPDNSVVGLVRPQALKKIQGNLAADEYRVYSIEQDLKNGEGLYEPVVVAYDPKTGYAVVAEGNHRVQAAIEAGEEFIPVVVRTNEVSKKKKGEFTPSKVEKTSGNFYSPDVEEGETREVNPYFVFPDSDILTPEEPGFDQRAGGETISVEADFHGRYGGILPSGTRYLEVSATPDGNRTLEELTGDPNDASTRLYMVDPVNVYYVESLDEYVFEKDLWDLDLTEEEREEAENSSESLIIGGLYALPEGWEQDSETIADIRRRRLTYGDLNVKLTPSEIAAVKNYTSSDDELISKKLRRGDELSGSDLAQRVSLDSVIDRVKNPYTPRLYRGVRLNPETVENMKVGDRITDPGYMSTTSSNNIAQEFARHPLESQGVGGFVDDKVKVIYKLSNPYTQKAYQVGGLSGGPDESEYILPRGTTLIIKKIETRDGYTYIDADVSSPELEAGLNQKTASLDDMLSILDKYRTKPAQGSSSPAPAVPEGTPGSKTNPLKLSTEEFTAKQAQVSDNNKTASQGVLAFVKEQLSRKNLRSWVEGYSRNKTRPLPVNPASDTHYRGANLIALEQAAEKNGFSDPRWMTATQVARAGGSIPAGTKGTKILVPTQLVTEVDGEIREIYEFKSVTVFNGDQIDGLAPYDSDSKKSYTAQEAVDIVLDRLREAADARGGSTPEIFGVQLGKDQNPRWMPNYSGVEKLRLPLRANFKSDEAWFQALAHELIHSTGSKDRLDRPELKTGLDRDADITDRSDSIAKEELTAELGSMILARMFGLGIDEENSARYLNFHINDRKLSEKDLQDAFSRAQLAVDHLLGNDVLPEWNPESAKVPPTPQSVRMIASTPEGSSLNPDTNPDTVDAPPMGFDQATKKSYGASKSVGSSKDAKERVLAGLLEKIKEGKAPWRKPFKDDANLAGAFVPRNPASKHIYTGINSLVLKLSQQIGGYSDPRWMTYNQALELGGQVRKGEKGVQILIPFKNVRRETDSATGEEKVAGSYVTFGAKAVFNVEQIDGLNLPSVKDEAGEPKTPLEAQEFILDRYQKSMEAKGLKAPKVTYTYVGNYGSHSSSPNWSPSSDVITLPTQEQFNSPEDMFDTIAHELAHSTGHKDRLDRTELTKDYGTDNAARGKEELIAEISSAILASMFGVNSDFDNTAAYVQSWLEALQNNPEMVMSASSDAQKVVDYLLGMDLGDWSPIEGYKSSTKSKSDGDSNE